MSKNIYLLITVAIKDDADPLDTFENVEYDLKHDNILEYELLGWREDPNG